MPHANEGPRRGQLDEPAQLIGVKTEVAPPLTMRPVSALAICCQIAAIVPGSAARPAELRHCVVALGDRVAGLMEERLGVRGKGLTEKLRRGGRLLPRGVRAQAQELAALSEKAQNPKLLVQIDPARVASCYDS